MQDDDDSSDNEGLAFQIRADLDDLRPRLSSQRKRRKTLGSESAPVKLNKLQRATRSERTIIRANRRLRRPPPPCPRPPLVKTASRQSLHSRRHLAHMLAFQVQLGRSGNSPYRIMYMYLLLYFCPLTLSMMISTDTFNLDLFAV
jgi:hypothetical protein